MAMALCDEEKSCSCKLNRWGYAVNTISDECIALMNAYSEEVLCYGAERHIILKAGEADPDCVAANTLMAFFLFTSSSVSVDALNHLQVAKSKLGMATAYEKMLFDSVWSIVQGTDDEDTILDVHFKLLKDFPKDLVSLKRAQVLCFCMGRSDLSLQFVEQALPANQDESYIYGMHSFSLLEVGKMRDAEMAARKGLAVKRTDAWSQHALCHVLHHQCSFSEAVNFMEACADSWNGCCSFMYTHNWWHVALCYLEGHANLSKVLNIYDSHIWVSLQRRDVDSTQVYLNALGLLLAIHVRGCSDIIHDRMRDLADHLMDHSAWHKEWLLDLLAIWALACANEFSQADELLQGMKSRIHKLREKARHCMQRVLLLAEALYHYGKNDYLQAYDILGPNFNVHEYKVIGASDEQLDVFDVLWCATLLNSGHVSQAIEALEQRVKVRCGVPFTWRLLEKAYSMEGGEASRMASAKAKALETTYFT